MRFDVLTLHPKMCEGPLQSSILGRAQAADMIEVGVHNLRDWAEGKHRQADDTPYGGGSGMVMRVDVVDRGIEAVRKPGGLVVLMDPTGTPFVQATAARLAQASQLVLVCGHYEGIDARVRDHLVDEVISVGDYVLTGGELPALVVIDAVARLVPGVLGNPNSAIHESFTDGQLEASQYTRPRVYRDWEVPEVLLSGHHGRIAEWRAAESATLTRSIRPDLLEELETVADSGCVSLDKGEPDR
jgi:tRNA (guanine37-N1)-methyltransferase